MTAQPLLFAAAVDGATFSDRAAFEAHMKAEHPRGLQRPVAGRAGRNGKVETASVRYSAPTRPSLKASALTKEEAPLLGKTVHGGSDLGDRIGQVWSLAVTRGRAWVVAPAAAGGNELVSVAIAEIVVGAPVVEEAPAVEEPAAVEVPKTLADLLAVLDAAA